MDPYNYQVNPKFSPPEEPKRGRGKWFIIGGVIALFLGMLIFFAVRIGKGIGKNFGEFANNALTKADSLSEQSNNEQYDRIYASLGTDSASQVYRSKIDSLKARTERIISGFNSLRSGFRDTLNLTKASAFDKRPSHIYFIKSGKALRMKYNLQQYRSSSIAEMNDPVNAETYKTMLMIDEIQKAMPGMLKKLLSWENMYFDQPPQTVLTNILTLKTQVRSFESALLAYYEVQVNMLPEPVSDSVIDSVL